MNKVTKAGVERWLHKLAKATKQLVAINDYNDIIGVCKINETSSKPYEPGLERHDVPYVHLSDGMHEIGKLLDIDIIKDDEDDEYVYYHFMWENVMFIQLDHKKEESK